MKKARLIALGALASLLSMQTYASTYTEVEPNSTCLTAQVLQNATLPLQINGYKTSSQSDAVDYFKFNADPGTKVRAVAAGNGFPAGLGLFASNCILQTSNFSNSWSSPAQLDFTVGSNGIFVLAVTASYDMSFTGSGTLSGAYTLSVQGNNEDLIAPVTSTPFGRTYGQWASAWWQWVLGAPQNDYPQASGRGRINPLNDLTGRWCGEHQIGDVWFLAGSWVGNVTRSCTIPAGKALFFPLINNSYFGFLSDPPEMRTEKYAHDSAVCTEPATISAYIDGQVIYGPQTYFTGASGSQSPAFNVQMPAGVAQGGPGNVFEALGYKIKNVPEWFLGPSAEQGYYLLIKPLAAGQHTLNWTASGCTAGATQEVTYNLTVLAN